MIPDRTNRLWLRALLASLLVAAACTTSVEQEPASEKRRPNILVIMTDDQPVKDTLSVMPRTRRWFVDGGTTFANAYATTPLCCPSRASFFSGRYTHNHKVYRSTPGQAEKLDQDSTLQRYLTEQGYRSAIYGKYLNHWDLDRDPPFFDDWAIFEGGKPLGYFDGMWNVNGKRKKITRYSTHYVQRRALKFVQTAEEDDDRPWVMFVHPYAPHLPYTLPKGDKGAKVSPWEPDPSVTETDLSDKPPFARTVPDSVALGEKLRERQLQTLVHVDRLVGKLMSSLQDLGEGSDTLAFYSSDNGYMWGDHQLIKKSAPYTGSAQIPLLARGPQWFDAGAVDERIVANIDLAPTVYDVVGIDPQDDLPVDGVSLLEGAERQDILLEYFSELPEELVYVPWASVLTKNAQYIEYYENDLETVRFREYYDLQTDPFQLENLLGDREPGNDPDLAKMEQRLESLRSCTGASCR